MIKIANAVAFELIFQEHWNDETYDNEVTGIVALGGCELFRTEINCYREDDREEELITAFALKLRALLQEDDGTNR
jgi:hypothetical protein